MTSHIAKIIAEELYSLKYPKTHVHAKIDGEPRWYELKNNQWQIISNEYLSNLIREYINDTFLHSETLHANINNIIIAYSKICFDKKFQTKLRLEENLKKKKLLFNFKKYCMDNKLMWISPHHMYTDMKKWYDENGCTDQCPNTNSNDFLLRIFEDNETKESITNICNTKILKIFYDNLEKTTTIDDFITIESLYKLVMEKLSEPVNINVIRNCVRDNSMNYEEKIDAIRYHKLGHNKNDSDVSLDLKYPINEIPEIDFTLDGIDQKVKEIKEKLLIPEQKNFLNNPLYMNECPGCNDETGHTPHIKKINLVPDIDFSLDEIQKKDIPMNIKSMTGKNGKILIRPKLELKPIRTRINNDPIDPPDLVKTININGKDIMILTKKNTKDDLHEVFKGKTLKNLNLKNADLRGIDMSNMHLIDSDLSGADLRGVSLEDTIITNTKMHNVDLRCAHLGGIKFYKVDLTGSKMYNIDCSFSKFKKTILDNVDMSSSDFNDSNFKKCNLLNANIIGSNLQNANLIDTGISPITIHNNNYKDVKFSGAYYQMQPIYLI
jgi:uncharacterized protein YjbI with pentapeptide repeats